MQVCRGPWDVRRLWAGLGRSRAAAGRSRLNSGQARARHGPMSPEPESSQTWPLKSSDFRLTPTNFDQIETTWADSPKSNGAGQGSAEFGARFGPISTLDFARTLPSSPRHGPNCTLFCAPRDGGTMLRVGASFRSARRGRQATVGPMGRPYLASSWPAKGLSKVREAGVDAHACRSLQAKGLTVLTWAIAISLLLSETERSS